MSDDEEERDVDPVSMAAAILIQTGSVERTERTLRQQTTDTNEEISYFVEEALLRVISGAPTELRPSFEAVCSYHRWTHMYGVLMKQGRIKDAMDAQKQLDALLKGVH